MRRSEAIARILRSLDDELVVTANGWISREACQAHDRPENFYMLGSMGLASSIGLGVALTNPSRRVIVLDGDGNLMMHLGVLAMIADARPANLVHVVLDNEIYGSTGGQRSLSGKVPLDALARAAGYAHVTSWNGSAEPPLFEPGPSFVLVKVAKEPDGTAPRVPHDPEEIAARFARTLRGVPVEID
jgi:sulfopyruvate decarboxylase subunit beta